MGISALPADDFFTIEKIAYRQRYQDVPDFYKSMEEIYKDGKGTTKAITEKTFAPFLDVQVGVKGQVPSDSITARVYFYDKDRKLLTSVDSPTQATWDTLIPETPKQSMCFVVPDKVLAQDAWSAIVVFGDAKGVDAQRFPAIGEEIEYDFPDKQLFNRDGPPLDRKPAKDSIIEHVVKTENPDQPQITLFMRPPAGMTDASPAKGVLCMSVIAANPDEVRCQLQGLGPYRDVNGYLKFAEENKLIVICWGSHNLWDPQRSWDELAPNVARNTDKAFDQVAEAWSNGIQYFIKEYGIPKNNYLLWGESGGAQYVCRLALRKPEYFLAVDMNIPSSFDKPTPDANRVLWCLTTGELEAGYQRSLRFYNQCRELGYPMIYKAIPGIAHTDSPIADDIAEQFFNYALSVGDQRVAYEESPGGSQTQPWIKSFRQPAFVGDIVNQEIFPSDQIAIVPPGFRTSLPTKAIADAWNQ
jgi:hypothetical protein